MRIVLASWIVCLHVGATIVLAAAPKVDYFFPAGVSRGQAATVTASGAFETWPVRIWVDREGLTIEPGETKGELSVSAGAEAAGVYWVRLYNEEGASSLRPLIVGALPEVNESETNDDPQQPQKLDGSAVVNGKLAKRGDVDGYAIALTEGQTLVASLRANETLGSPMDGVLQVANAEGLVLAQNDDARGLDPLLVFTAPRDGPYLVRTFAFPATPTSAIAFAGADNFVYRLTISTGPVVDHALPMALRADESTELRLFGWNLPEAANTAVPPEGDNETVTVLSPQTTDFLQLPATRHRLVVADTSNSPQAPQLVELPAIISGRIETPQDQDAFRFSAKKGQKVSLRVESRSLGSPMDPVLHVIDAEGKMLVEEDDTSRQPDPAITFAAPADGEYRVTVRDLHHHGGLRYVYRLTVEEETPDFALTLAADTFTLTPGKPLEIPVTVERQAGFSGEIEITAEGLPPGVTATPVQSLGSGETAKSVKLTLTAEGGPVPGPFTLVGRSRDDNPKVRVGRFPISGLEATHTQAWLTVP